jgi:cell pole-organizing protein PopZ
MAKLEPAPDPSMEDILASIRRIISDGDDGRKTPPTPHLAVVERAPVQIRGANREAAPSEEPAPPLAAIASAVVRADRAESVPGRKAQEGRLDLPPAPANASGGPAPVKPVILDSLEDEPEIAVARIGSAPPPAFEIEPVDDDPAPVMPPIVAAAAAPSNRPEKARAPQPAPELPRAAPELPRATPASPAEAGLLSAQADAAVHSAFDQLAGIMLSRESRTLEDIVKDMMRPMLRDWLDDNLPPLVERLVREEIQRVSRGRR